MSIPLRWSDGKHIKSSNHEVAVTYDYSRKFLEINVSIPKYFFGNNVIEIITPPHSKYFSVNNLSPYQHIKFWRSSIKKVLYKLLLIFSGSNFLPLDWTDVEIFRIDLCVNQVFDTKHEALRYLDLQKRYHKKYISKTSSAENLFPTSITFKTKNYYAKIYHKGTEFAKQSKKIRQQCHERARAGENLEGSNILNSEKMIPELQEYADRVLRYEFEFKASELTYIFNHRLNKHWSSHFLTMKKIYKYVSRSQENIQFIKNWVKKFEDVHGVFHDELVPNFIRIRFYTKSLLDGSKREFSAKEYRMIRILHKYGIKKHEHIKDWMKFMDTELNKSRHFFIATNDVNTLRKDIVNPHTKEVVGQLTPLTDTPTICKFSPLLMIACCNELNKFFNSFQIEQKTDDDTLRDKIQAHNDRINSEISAALLNIEKVRLKKLLVGFRLQRSLIEFQNLISRKDPPRNHLGTIYSKPTYYRTKRLYLEITGKKFQIAHSYLGNVNRDYNSIYRHLIDNLQFTYFADFYNSAFVSHHFEV